MQSPENTESSYIRRSGSNSKLHTPCRQIGLRRKKSKTSDTPIKENKSPEVKTNTVVEESDHTSRTPTFINTSDCSVIDENQTKVKCRLHMQNPVKEKKSPDVKTDTAVEECDHTSSTPMLINISDCAVNVDENQTKEKCKLQKPVKENNLTPAAVINSGNSENVKKEVEVIKKRIKEKEEKIAALRLAKLYRKKHDTNTLSELTEKWREGCQAALQELFSSSTAHGYQINMSQLITQLGIPFHLIRYNPDLEDFE